jgi:hypothetical protein
MIQLTLPTTEADMQARLSLFASPELFWLIARCDLSLAPSTESGGL